MGNPLDDILALLFVFVAIVLVAGLLHRAKSPYDRIGAGGTFVPEKDAGPPEEREIARRRDRDTEIRQMLQARSERLERQGKAPLDVDAELARLLSGQPPGTHHEDSIPPASPGAASRHDPELLAEVRQLVAARNERRVRSGEPPLDVESEVARRISELPD